MATQKSLIDLVEAIWAIDRPEIARNRTRWLETIVQETELLLGEGAGTQGFLIDLRRTGGDHLHSPVLYGGEAHWQSRWLEAWWQPVMQPLTREAAGTLCSQPLSTSTSLWPQAAVRSPELSSHFHSLADGGWGSMFGRVGFGSSPSNNIEVYPDSLNVVGVDARGVGVALVVNLRSPRSVLPKALQTRWARVAAHLTTALRLRTELEKHPELLPTEAVLTPTGQLLHAEGAAKEPTARALLEHATRSIDRCRAKPMRDSPEGLELWKSLHDGRWSLVDEVEHDGKRLILARANPPLSPSNQLGGLSPRESQVLEALAQGYSNKTIAYQLGLGVSTVSSLLTRAARKLGAKNTTELLQLARARLRQHRAL